MDISEAQYKAGGISENDYLKIKLQLLQFQQDVQQAQLAKAQALSDLRQLLGYESVPADYDGGGRIRLPAAARSRLADLQTKALREPAGSARGRAGGHRRGQPVRTCQSEWESGRDRLPATIRTSTASAPPLSQSASRFRFSTATRAKSRGRSYAITQAQQQQTAAQGQVMTDVRDAYEALETNDRVAQYFRSGYLDVSQKNRDISEYAYRRGAASLLDFLDAERSYRATQLAWRQTIAAYLTALEQLREAVGTRSLP